MILEQPLLCFLSYSAVLYLFWLYSTLLPEPRATYELPEPRATYEPAAGAALRESHPSEDRSEVPPSKWLDTEYHYRLTGSLRNSLPKLFWAGWTRSAPFMAVVFYRSAERRYSFRKFYRWSSRTRRIAASPRQGAHKLTLVRCRI